MKIRNNFVSNSSSSSYICDNCQEVFSIDEGISRSEYGIYECEEEHVICSNCLSEELVNKFDKSLEDDDSMGYIPKELCPICQMKIITHNDIQNYINKKYNINIKKIEQEIKEKFKTYTLFQKYLKK